MAGVLDVGTLSGRIQFEDKVTSSLDLVLNRLDAVEKKFGSTGAQVAKTAAGFTVAEVAISAFNKALELGAEFLGDFTVGGAGLGDIRENFERLTGSAANVSPVLKTLNESLHGTVDELTLMTTVNSNLAAGLKLTDEEYRALADGAFALAQATGEDVATAFDKVNEAMKTGRTLSLQTLTGKIDLTQAEQDFAESLGTTTDMLSQEGKLQAAREAILRSVGAATERLGEQTDGLDEMIAQAITTAKNWYDQLSIGIATSPNVIAAFEAIRDALFDAFGGDAQGVLESIMGWVNRVADAVAYYGPIAIDWFRTAVDWVRSLYAEVITTWEALPTWFREVAVQAALAGAGFVVVGAAAGAASAPLTAIIDNATGVVAAIAVMPKLLRDMAGSLVLLKGLSVLDFTSFATARISVNLLGGSLLGMLGPMGAVAAAAAAMFAAWQIGNWQPVKDFFHELGLELMGFSQAEQDAALAADHAAKAIDPVAEALKRSKIESEAAAEGARKLADEQIEAAKAASELAAEEQKKNFVLQQTQAELKKYNEALEALNAVGLTVKDTINQVDGSIVEAVKHYLDAGVALDKLKVVYALTDEQANAIKKTWDEHNKVLDKQKEKQKEVAEALGNLNELSKDHNQLLHGIGDRIRDDVGRYHDLGASVKDLATAYRLTEVQVRAIIGIREAERLATQSQNQAYGEQNSLLDESQQKVRTLSGEFISLAEAKRRAGVGGSTEITKATLAEAAQNFGIPPAFASELAKLGYSFAEIVTIYRSGLGTAYGPPQGPRIPGFREGGVGDFGDGTLAMLHGKEAIVPLDQAGGFGSVALTFHVNGTGMQVAQDVKRVIMRELKTVRRFGAA